MQLDIRVSAARDITIADVIRFLKSLRTIRHGIALLIDPNKSVFDHLARRDARTRLLVRPDPRVSTRVTELGRLLLQNPSVFAERVRSFDPTLMLLEFELLFSAEHYMESSPRNRARHEELELKLGYLRRGSLESRLVEVFDNIGRWLQQTMHGTASLLPGSDGNGFFARAAETVEASSIGEVVQFGAGAIALGGLTLADCLREIDAYALEVRGEILEQEPGDVLRDNDPNP